jgi:hypothetical protein
MGSKYLETPVELLLGNSSRLSIREPGRIKGVRLFHLASIFAFIGRCEASALRQEQIG